MIKIKIVSLLLSQEASIECYLTQHIQINFSRNPVNRKSHLWELLQQAIEKALNAPNHISALPHWKIVDACLSKLGEYHHA